MAIDPGDWLGQRRIRLLNRDDRLVVSAASLHLIEPFPMPRLPITQLLWCQNVCHLFYSRHQARLAILLLLDCRTTRWQPLIPTQRCGKRSASIDPSLSDFFSLPRSLHIAGSFQSSGLSGIFAAKAAVPPFDGLHVVQQRRRQASWIFLARAGEITLAHPSVTTIDDLKQAIDLAGDRLHLD